MIDRSSSKLHLAVLRNALDKWRVAFLVFVTVYAVLLVISLSNGPMVWDEAVHLNNVFLLKTGYDNFISKAYYPPLFELVTAGFFNTLGVTLFNGRLVSAVFSILTLWAVFELANSMYGKKTALISAVLLGAMPGYFWLSSKALLDVMLLFFIVLSFLFFYRWLQNGQKRMLILGGLALGLGFLTKYQVLAAAVALILGLVVLGWGQLKRMFLRFTLLIVTSIAVVVPWVGMVYKVYANQILNQWIYVIQIGTPQRVLYSSRFPLPIFYFVEMTWPFNGIHPISLLLYAVGILGLGLLVWRHSKADRFVAIWFASIFVFFTLISNKEWRYVLPLFPAVAISAAVFILLGYGKLQSSWQRKTSISRKRAAKIAAALFIAFLVVAIAYSMSDTYSWVEIDHIQIDIQAATNYVIAHDNGSQSIMVLCPFNFFSQDMVKFYLWESGRTQIQTFQYPKLPVDAYTPTFNIAEFVSLCTQNNVGYVFTYENGGTVPYFNTTLNLQQIYIQLYGSGNFSKISARETFGSDPRRIFILNFTG